MTDPLTVTGVLTAVGGVAGHVAVSGVVEKAIHLLRARVHAMQAARGERALASLVEEIAVLLNTTSDDAAERLVAAIADASPECVDALVDSFARTMNTVDGSAVPYIARLTAPYLVERRGRDRFFLRAGRMLQDTDAEQLAALRLVFAAIRMCDLTGGQEPVAVRVRQDRNPPRLRVFLGEVINPDGDATVDGEGTLGLRAIANAGLSSEGSGGAGASSSVWVQFTVADFPWLVQLLRIFA